MRVIQVAILSVVLGAAAGVTLAYVNIWRDPDAFGLPGSAPKSSLDLPTDSNMPRVLAESADYDFGSMQKGTKKTHNFTIKNVGSAPLTLRVGSTSCKCTRSEVTDNAIPPGGTGQLFLEWIARVNAGPFRQTATILTNDPLNSSLVLTVHGDVTEAQGVEPRELSFDKMSAGEIKSATVYVMAMASDNLTVSDPQLSDAISRDKFDVKIEPVDKAALPNPHALSGVKITVTSKPGMPVGRFNQFLVLKTNLPDAEHLEIPVTGSVVGNISVHGPNWNDEQDVLLLGTINSAEGKKTKLNVMVRGEGAGDVKFDLASCDPPELKVTIGEPQKLRDTLVHVPVEIEVPPGTRPMVHTDTAQGEAGRIVLKTTHATIKELVMTVRFSVER